MYLTFLRTIPVQKEKRSTPKNAKYSKQAHKIQQEALKKKWINGGSIFDETLNTKKADEKEEEEEEEIKEPTRNNRRRRNKKENEETFIIQTMGNTPPRQVASSSSPDKNAGKINGT
jgi:hypothetical protein